MDKELLPKQKKKKKPRSVNPVKKKKEEAVIFGNEKSASWDTQTMKF